MTDKYIPPIGTSGFYNLNTPYDAAVSPGERYTLKSIRRISDYIANNEDVKTEVYVANGIESAYAADSQNDVEILNIQSERGHWLQVPVTYVKSYPNFNGIPYRALQIVIPMNPIPVDTDLSGLISQLADVVKDSQGFTVVPKVVEASRVILIDSTVHQNKQTDRALVKADSTPAAQIETLTNQLNTALDQVAALQAYLQTYMAAHP